MVYLDLDNFKKVNDAYGHMFGDQLLQAVALAILSCLDEGQTLARLGGDEFIVLATDTSQGALEAMASRILTRLRQPFRIGLMRFTPAARWASRLRPSTVTIAKASFVMPTPPCTPPKKMAGANSASSRQR